MQVIELCKKTESHQRIILFLLVTQQVATSHKNRTLTSISCNIRKKTFQIGTGKTYAKSSVPRFYWCMN